MGLCLRICITMTPTPYTLKSSALAALRRRYAEQRGQVLGIETRLADYFDGLVTVEPNADADPQDPQPCPNITPWPSPIQPYYGSRWEVTCKPEESDK